MTFATEDRDIIYQISEPSLESIFLFPGWLRYTGWLVDTLSDKEGIQYLVLLLSRLCLTGKLNASSKYTNLINQPHSLRFEMEIERQTVETRH